MNLRKFLRLAFEPGHAEKVILHLQPRMLKKQVLMLRLNQAATVAHAADMDLGELVDLMLERRCKNCGCTESDSSQCIAKTGEPCHWIGPELCSACGLAPAKAPRTKKSISQLTHD